MGSVGCDWISATFNLGKQAHLTGQAKKLIYPQFPLTDHNTETFNYRGYALVVSYCWFSYNPYHEA